MRSNLEYNHRRALSLVFLWIFTVYSTGFSAQIHLCSGHFRGFSKSASSSCCSSKRIECTTPSSGLFTSSDSCQGPQQNNNCCSNKDVVLLPDWDSSYLTVGDCMGHFLLLKFRQSPTSRSLPVAENDFPPLYSIFHKNGPVRSGAEHRVFLASFRC